MSTIITVANRIMQLDLEREIPSIIERTENDIANIQRGQLFKGVKSDENAIEPGYTANTVRIKKAKGQPTDRVTLKDKGDFYQGININVQGDKFEITSSDHKTKKLEDKYGVKIFGFSNESRGEYIKENFFPQLKAYIENTTKLQMI